MLESDITLQHAEPPKDQICQVSFQYHNLHRFYSQTAHQLLRSFAATHISIISCTLSEAIGSLSRRRDSSDDWMNTEQYMVIQL